MAVPIDLNSQLLNKDGKKGADFTPAEELRLNMSIAPTASPNRLGVLAKDLAGFPNGRRLTDDVVDIEIQALEGAAQTSTLVAALAAGDGVDQNDVAFGQSFPYVALPHNAAVNRASTGGAARPSVASGSTGSAAGSGTAPSAAPSGSVGAGAEGTAGRSSSLPLLPLSAGLLAIIVASTGVVTLRRNRS